MQLLATKLRRKDKKEREKRKNRNRRSSDTKKNISNDTIKLGRLV